MTDFPPAVRADFSLGVRDDEPPTTAALRQVLDGAAQVVVVEASPDEVDAPDAARIELSGEGIAELARLLAVVDGGTGDRCRCPGWPTILVRDASGRDIAQWTLHHQTGLRGVGDGDADLRDGPALSDWLAARGLTGSRETQQLLAEYEAQEEHRRVAWVRAAPPGLTEVAEAASRREDDGEERLAELAVRRYPDPAERIALLLAWAGFPAHAPPVPGGGTPAYELAPEQMLLSEPAESIFEVLAAAPTAAQLDGAADLFTALSWKKKRPDPPEPLRAVLIAHVSATGTDEMRSRMRHGYGRPG
ncbi:hypothetical protein [Catellatospora paridis]|uniref:hypothetical protein n=1 Tax=Catellatospora paridis TaxID=1617086 RepID=UPI0012D40502|nr:hypothetical protein [Catellatospora paridis]